MKFFLLILAIVAGFVWYTRIQKDLTTWRASVETLAGASQGAALDPEESESLITLLEHKPYRIALTSEEKDLLAKARGEAPASASASAPTSASPGATPRPANMAPAPAPMARRTPSPQEVAEAIARKYGSKR